MTILVTGGAGFIGANFVLEWRDAGDEAVVNLDKLTYAGNLRNLQADTGMRQSLGELKDDSKGKVDEP